MQAFTAGAAGFLGLGLAAGCPADVTVTEQVLGRNGLQATGSLGGGGVGTGVPATSPPATTTAIKACTCSRHQG
jgi:hypothetical protein